MSRTINEITPLSLDTTELTEALQAIYQQQSTLPRLFSEREDDISDAFMNVSIFRQEVVKAKERELDSSHNKDEESSKEMEDNRLHSHERLYEVHEPIPIEKLFESLSRIPLKKLLLYGRAGIGKTVLCQYIANQWAEGSLDGFKQFKAVFWIKLRELSERLKGRRDYDKPINLDMILAEIVTTCCLRDRGWQKEIKKQQLEVWLEAHAEQTLFILDGYDEIAEIDYNSDLEYCLDAILSQIQYRPYVLLTSRPVVIASRYSSFDRRLECMGFTNENIKAFVQQYLPNPQESSACLTFLKAHSSIWGTAHIPINLELICWLWSRGESANKQCLTMAALYTEIVEKVSRENANKHSLLKEQCRYHSYDEKLLITKTITYFAQEFLSFIGFCAMRQSDILLSGKKIREWAYQFIKKTSATQINKPAFEAEVLLTACLRLGLLKSAQEGSRYLFDHSYYFIHLSFQEFFAARYYQQAFEYADEEAIHCFKANKYTASYQLAWWMCAGLLYQRGNCLRNYDGLTHFLRTLCSEPLDLIGIHHFKLLSHCLDECQADQTVDIIVRLVEYQANFFNCCLEESWLAETWGSTLLRCSNLLQIKPFKNKILNFIEKLKEMKFINQNAAALLSHVATKKVITSLTDTAIQDKVHLQLAIALTYHSDLTTTQLQALIDCLTDSTIPHSILSAIIEQVQLIMTLAESLAKRPDVIPEQIQALIACIADMSIHSSVRKRLAESLAKRSGLTSEQVQTLTAYLTDRTIDESIRISLAQVLAGRSDLTTKQLQALIVCLADTTTDGWVRAELTEALLRRPDLIAKQLIFIPPYLADTAIHKSVHGSFTYAFARRPNLTPKQIEHLSACLADTTIDDYIRDRLAQVLAQRPDLTTEQVQLFIAYLTKMTIRDWARKRLDQILAQYPDLAAGQEVLLIAYLEGMVGHESVCGGFAYAIARQPNLTPKQIEHLSAYLVDTTIDDYIRDGVAQAFVQRPDLTIEQVQHLITYLTDTTIDNCIRYGFAQALVQRPDLTIEQVQLLIDYLIKTSVKGSFSVDIAEVLAQYPDLTAEQAQFLITCWEDDRYSLPFEFPWNLKPKRIQHSIAYLEDTTIEGSASGDLAKALTLYLDLKPEQVQYFIPYLIDTTIDDDIRQGLAQVLLQRLDLTAKQIELLIACLEDTVIENREDLCQELAQGFALRSNLEVEQLPQLLAYYLKEKIIYERCPDLIFQILRIYYSNNPLKQLEPTVLSELGAYLTNSSGWFWLIRQQVLFICNEETYTVQLRLKDQTFEIHLETSFLNNSFLEFVHEKWGGNLHLDTLFLSTPINATTTLSAGSQISKDSDRKEKPVAMIGENTTIHGSVNIQQTYTGMSYTGGAADFLSLVDNSNARQVFSDERQEAGVKISKQVIPVSTKINQSVNFYQKSCGLRLNTIEQATAIPISPVPTLVLTKELKDLLQDSVSVEKNYCFLLKRKNANTLIITCLSSKESPRAEGRQLDALQKAMETCLKTASLEYECSLSGKNEEILTVTDDKKVIHALADLLVRQGLNMELAEVNKRSAFFKAEKSELHRLNSEEDESTFTCTMQ